MVKNFVEIGRIAVINSGPSKGKFCVIVNIVDHRRVLIDAPRVKGSNNETDVKRQTYPTRHLRLTRFKLRLRHDENHDVISKMWNDSKVTEKVLNTRYVRRQLNSQKKANLTDFERFKLYKVKQRVNKLLKPKMRALKDRYGKPTESKEEKKKNRETRLAALKKKKSEKAK